jgi:hypothetical protein
MSWFYPFQKTSEVDKAVERNASLKELLDIDDLSSSLEYPSSKLVQMFLFLLFLCNILFL